VPERNHAIKQSVIVHEKSRKAEPFNVTRKFVQVVDFNQTEQLAKLKKSLVQTVVTATTFSADGNSIRAV